MRQGSSNNRIPFGVRKGRTYSASQVETGLACLCTCPECGQPLVAKNAGSRRAAHFAHHGKKSECQHAGETSMHRHAKQIISESAHLLLPSWNGTEQMPNPPHKRDASGKIHYGRDVAIPQRATQLQNIELEKRYRDLQPDVSATDADGPLLIEIRVSHAVEEAKTAKVQSDGVRMMEIDLSKVSVSEALDPAHFEDLVLRTANNRHWLSFPRASDSWRQSLNELNERVRLIDQGLAVGRAGSAHGDSAQNKRVLRKNGARNQEPISREYAAAKANDVHLTHEAYRHSDPDVGRWIWHEGLGCGIVRGKLTRCGAVYVVEFESGLVRKTWLHPGFTDWEFIDRSNVARRL